VKRIFGATSMLFCLLHVTSHCLYVAGVPIAVGLSETRPNAADEKISLLECHSPDVQRENKASGAII
jgi:hypothetical protein